jgi:hypothetical protein
MLRVEVRISRSGFASAPAFGRVESASRWLVIGTAKAVPFRQNCMGEER